MEYFEAPEDLLEQNVADESCEELTVEIDKKSFDEFKSNEFPEETWDDLPELVKAHVVQHNFEMDGFSDELPELENPDADTKTDESPAPVKYGFDEDGKYVTPYQTTLFYNADDVLGQVIAGTLYRGQAIPLHRGLDISKMGHVCEHPSPEVLVLADVSVEAVQSCIERNFQIIHILRTTHNTDERFANVERVKLFDLEDIYSHVRLEQGLGSALAVEYTLIATYPEYKSELSVEKNRAELFVSGLGADITETVRDIANSIRGADLLEKIINRGELVREYGDSLADLILKKGYTKTIGEEKYYVVQGAMHYTAVAERCKTCKKFQESGAKYIVFADLDADNEGLPIWRVTLLDTTSCAATGALNTLFNGAAGTNTVASVLAKTKEVSKFF